MSSPYAIPRALRHADSQPTVALSLSRIGMLSNAFEICPQRVVGLEDVSITSASAGDAHSLFISSDGAAFSCGRNQHGQTGRPRSTSAQLLVAKRIPGLEHVRVVAAAAGDSHSLLLTEDGEVYACGSNSYGQLVRCLGTSNAHVG